MKKHILFLLVVLGTAAGMQAQQPVVSHFQLRVMPLENLYFQANDSVLDPSGLMGTSDTVAIGINALVTPGPDSVYIELSDSSEALIWSGTRDDFGGFATTASGYLLFNPALFTTAYLPFIQCTAQFFYTGGPDITLTRTFNNQQ